MVTPRVTELLTTSPRRLWVSGNPSPGNGGWTERKGGDPRTDQVTKGVTQNSRLASRRDSFLVTVPLLLYGNSEQHNCGAPSKAELIRSHLLVVCATAPTGDFCEASPVSQCFVPNRHCVVLPMVGIPPKAGCGHPYLRFDLFSMFWDFGSLHQKPRVGGTIGGVLRDGPDGWRSPVTRSDNTGRGEFFCVFRQPSSAGPSDMFRTSLRILDSVRDGLSSTSRRVPTLLRRCGVSVASCCGSDIPPSSVLRSC